jgi:peroxiredoxin
LKGQRLLRGIGMSNLMLLLATGLVVVLGLRARALRMEVAGLLIRANSLPEGSLAPLVGAPTLAHDSVLLGSTDRHGLLYLVYNTRCPHCETSLPAWIELYNLFDKSGEISVLAISLDTPDLTREFQANHSLGFETVVLTDPRVKDIHRFGVVPQTILLDPDGRVVLARVGVLEFGPAFDSVFAAIDELAEMGRS